MAKLYHGWLPVWQSFWRQKVGREFTACYWLKSVNFLLKISKWLKIFTEKKKSLKKSSWFGEPKCKTKVQGFLFYFFSLFFFNPWVQILAEWKTCYELKTLLRVNKLSHFLTNSQLDMLDFVDLHKMLVRRSAFFSPFKCMELNWKVEYKVKGQKHKFSQMKGNLDL